MTTLDPALRYEIEDLYATYSEMLDEGPLASWPDLFTEHAVYRVVPRENWDRELPLSTIWAENRAMLRDRVLGVTKTMVYAPHYWRHLISAIRPIALPDGAIEVRANYCVIRTAPDEPSELFQAGRYLDALVRENGRLRFRSKLCIFDTLLIPNSLIYPV